MKLRYLGTSLIALLSLDSCYFNSAQHFTSHASYKAASKTSDIKNGDVVYTDGSRYYVELPRYRVGKKIYWQISAGASDTRQVSEFDSGYKELFEVPRDFAMYLTDPSAKTGAEPSFMTRVKNPDEVKKIATTKLPILYKAGKKSVSYNYSSPNAVWWWTGGVFSWLCFDLPITCAEIATDAAAIVCVGFLTLYSDEETKRHSKYGCSTCHGTGQVVSGETQHLNARGAVLYTTENYSRCPDCSGSGWNERGTEMIKERGSLWPPFWHVNF